MTWNSFLDREQLDELDEMMILQFIRELTHLVFSLNKESLIA